MKLPIQVNGKTVEIELTPAQIEIVKKANQKITDRIKTEEDIWREAGVTKTLLHEIIAYLKTKLSLDIKSNYQVFPVEVRGIDFVGYRIFHTHVKLRKSIKLRYIKKMVDKPSDASKAAYNGWLKHCNSKSLQNKYEQDSCIA